MKSNTMLAVDCEMDLCEDGTDAVVKVCVVDHNLEVKLDEFVKPNKNIVDYRTEITSISSQDLETVTCSLADIQKSMKKLLSKGTILVGHSLHNNLCDNPYDVADKWLLKENLPLSFPEQVVQFVLQNTGQNNVTFDASFRDPYTGSNTYVPGQPSHLSGLCSTLMNLEVLDLSENNFSDIAYALSGLSSLKSLNLGIFI